MPEHRSPCRRGSTLDGQGVAVRSKSRRGQFRSVRRPLELARDRVPRPLNHTHGEARDVEVVRCHHSTVFGGLAAEQRRARLSTSFGDASDQLFESTGFKFCQRRRSRARRAVRRRRTRGRQPTSPPGRYPPCRSAQSDARPQAWCPTPSAEATSTGSLYFEVSSAKRPPKPPMPPRTSGRFVLATTSLIRRNCLVTRFDRHARTGVGNPVLGLVEQTAHQRLPAVSQRDGVGAG